jgi:DNA polymerase-4
LSTPPRRIAHLDMDAFYASVDLLRYPELRGRPLVIGGSGAQQPLLLADGSRPFRPPARLCRPWRRHHRHLRGTRTGRLFGDGHHGGSPPGARRDPAAGRFPGLSPLLAPLQDGGRAASHPTAKIEASTKSTSISAALAGDSRSLAQRIKDAVRQATGLSCSIGVAPNKLLAKIASDLDKPDGLTILGSDDLRQRIWPLPVRKINGIGPKASERLALLGIHSIGELAQADGALLRQHFGHGYGAWLLAAAHGIDERPLVTAVEAKSISRETTFARDLHPRDDRETLSGVLVGLCRRLADDLQRKRCRGRTIGVKLRFADFRVVTRDLTVARGDRRGSRHPARQPRMPASRGARGPAAAARRARQRTDSR